jgi:DNA-binding transcriptional regulator YdaS (Cro superfamily)
MKNAINPAAFLLNAIGADTQAQWARKHNISPAYVNDVINGRREPGPAILEALGIERVVSYRPKPPASEGEG